VEQPSRGGEAVRDRDVVAVESVGEDAGQAYFYPYAGTVIDHAKHQNVERGPQGLC